MIPEQETASLQTETERPESHCVPTRRSPKITVTPLIEAELASSHCAPTQRSPVIDDSRQEMASLQTETSGPSLAARPPRYRQ
jgi:hypothetical protein